MKKPYLICYDISCPKRLQKVHKLTVHYAVPLQYSVFYALITMQQIKEITTKFEQIIDETKDDIRIYPIDGTTLANWQKRGFEGDDHFLRIS